MLLDDYDKVNIVLRCCVTSSVVWIAQTILDLHNMVS